MAFRRKQREAKELEQEQSRQRTSSRGIKKAYSRPRNSKSASPSPRLHSSPSPPSGRSLSPSPPPTPHQPLSRNGIKASGPRPRHARSPSPHRHAHRDRHRHFEDDGERARKSRRHRLDSQDRSKSRSESREGTRRKRKKRSRRRSKSQNRERKQKTARGNTTGMPRTGKDAPPGPPDGRATSHGRAMAWLDRARPISDTTRAHSTRPQGPQRGSKATPPGPRMRWTSLGAQSAAADQGRAPARVPIRRAGGEKGFDPVPRPSGGRLGLCRLPAPARPARPDRGLREVRVPPRTGIGGSGAVHVETVQDLTRSHNGAATNSRR